MPSRDAVRRFSDIVENIDLIHSFISGFSFEEYVSDSKTRYAVRHALLLISEAAAKLGIVAEQQCPEQPWQRIRAFGNVLRHEYDKVEERFVWRTITNDLAFLRQSCARQRPELPGS